MNWLMFMFAVEAGLLSGGQAIYQTAYEYPDQSTYSLFEAEAQAGPFFIGGSVETHQQYVGAVSFAPYRALYGFNTGLRHSFFEVGWRHMCDHGVFSSTPVSPVSGGYDRFYVRVEVRK